MSIVTLLSKIVIALLGSSVPMPNLLNVLLIQIKSPSVASPDTYKLCSVPIVFSLLLTTESPRLFADNTAMLSIL